MQRRIEVLRHIERQYMKEGAARLGMHPLEGMLLHLVDSRGPVRQEDLSAWTGGDKGRVARTLAGMEASGLVERRVSPSCRREKQVTLTREGGRMVEEIHRLMDEWNEICYAGFTQEEREAYSQLLNRIVDNAVSYRQKGARNG